MLLPFQIFYFLRNLQHFAVDVLKEMIMNRNRLIKTKLSKIILTIKNQNLKMVSFGFQTIRNRSERNLMKKKKKINKKIFQKEFLQKICQIFKPSEKMVKKRFFTLLRNLQRKDILIRIRQYEALKKMILNHKLLLRRFFSVFCEKSNFNFSGQNFSEKFQESGTNKKKCKNSQKIEIKKNIQKFQVFYYYLFFTKKFTVFCFYHSKNCDKQNKNILDFRVLDVP